MELVYSTPNSYAVPYKDGLPDYRAGQGLLTSVHHDIHTMYQRAVIHCITNGTSPYTELPLKHNTYDH